MKTIDQLAREFHECFPVISENNATLKGVLWDAWQGGRQEANAETIQGVYLFTDRDEVEAGIEMANEMEMTCS